MKNAEIDLRLKALSRLIPERAQTLYKKFHDRGISDNSAEAIRVELELLNMGVMAIWTMLGEIAKRLPEGKE